MKSAGPLTPASRRFGKPLVRHVLCLVVGVLGTAQAQGGSENTTKMEESPFATSAAWRQLPSYPREAGVAGVLVGQHSGVLIAGGGANFPDAPPWAGGKKKTYDDLYVYSPSGNAWRVVGKLPEPRAYAAVVSVPTGVLICGGENADKVFQDSVWLRWDGQGVNTLPGPPLPSATTSPVAAVLGDRIYLASGYSAGSPRLSGSAFWCLDWTDPHAEWTALPPCPGPSRGQAVMAAVAGAIYLFSGIEIVQGLEGKPSVTYLNDAYRYRPQQGWQRLPDLPRSAIAAPTPAPVTSGVPRIYLLGGVDGRLVAKQPRDTRVPDDILFFDVGLNEWKTLPGRWPDPVVTTPAVKLGDEWIFVSGETMAGVRTSHVWSWNIEIRP